MAQNRTFVIVSTVGGSGDQPDSTGGSSDDENGWYLIPYALGVLLLMAGIAPLNCALSLEKVDNNVIRLGAGIVGAILTVAGLGLYAWKPGNEDTGESLDNSDGPNSNSGGSETDDLITLFTHWDSSFWDASNFFLVFQSLLIAGTGLILSAQGGPFEQLRASGMTGFPILGVLVSGYWLLVMHRKRTYVKPTKERLKSRCGDVWEDIRSQQNGLASLSSSRIVKAVLPITFLLFWFAFFVFGVCNA